MVELGIRVSRSDLFFFWVFLFCSRFKIFVVRNMFIDLSLIVVIVMLVFFLLWVFNFSIGF